MSAFNEFTQILKEAREFQKRYHLRVTSDNVPVKVAKQPIFVFTQSMINRLTNALIEDDNKLKNIAEDGDNFYFPLGKD